jgi:hypothetical protein
MQLDEAALRADLTSAAFKLGVFRGRWDLVRVRFPYVWFRISKPALKRGPPFFLLRVDATSYPGPLTAQLWDARNDRALELERRPHGAGGVLIAFSNWGACLYHPIDRVARDHWRNQFDDLAWKAGSDIVTFLETVHALIHDPAYVQSTAPAEAAELPAEPLEEDCARVA